MVLGSVLVALCLVVMGWAKEIVGNFVDEGEFKKTCTIVVAVLSIYAVDFAINAGEFPFARVHWLRSENVLTGSSASVLSKLDS